MIHFILQNEIANIIDTHHYQVYKVTVVQVLI